MASSKIDVDATIGKAKEVALSAYARAEEEGLFSHFGDFNEDLITPVKGIMTDQNLAAAPTYKDKALYLLDQAEFQRSGAQWTHLGISGRPPSGR